MKNRFLNLLVIFISFSVFGQKSNLKKADNDYNNYAYIDAIDIYEKVAEKGNASPEMLKKLGNSYYFNANLKTAAKWYEQLFTLSSSVEPEYFYRYSQCLKALGNYKLANEYLDKFAVASSSDSRSQRFIKDKNYLDVIKTNSNRYKIEEAGINSEYSDYGGAFYKDEFVFTTARDTGNISKKIHSWSNQSFSDLYGAKITSEGGLTDVKKFSKAINTKFHESSAVFTKDGKTVYFTRNNFIKGKIRKNSDQVVMLKLYKAENKNGKWTNIVELPFNSDEYNIAHPSLSFDDKILYFASDMPGTLGNSDIFKVAINDDGSFGQPENLGPEINTEARETFPYITDQNELFFASDGHLGLGGLDIFVVKYSEDGSLSNVFNVGAPVNSSSDDFGYIVNNSNKIGFFTTNRDGGKGNDDIYKFVEQIPLQYICKQIVSGVITDDETKEVLVNAKVTLFDQDMNIVKDMTVNEKGEFRFEDLKCEKTYFVRAESKDYETVETPVVTGSTSGETTAKLPITKHVNKDVVGSDLAKAFDIKVIYFNVDKFNIRADASIQLEKILQVMKQYPTMKVDVRSHTDCRQTSKYNLALSDRRVKSTIAWLIKNGISANRLTGKGYGESQLVNDCGCEPTNKSKCSEEEHQANRRSEFIITAM